MELTEVILRCLKILIDIFIFLLYMRLLHYFISFKLAKLRKNLVQFTCCNSMTIGLVFFLGVLAFYSTIMQLAYLVARYIMLDNSNHEIELLKIYEVEHKIVWPLIDWAIATAIIYLFFNMGRKKIKNERSL